MRIPATPETPESSREFYALELCAFYSAFADAAQQKNKYSHDRLCADQFPRMKKVFGKRENHQTREEQIAERKPLKRAQPGPHARHFAAPGCNFRRFAIGA